MCEIRSKEKQQITNQKKEKYSGQLRKKMDCDEPHLMPNEKTQPIQWTEWPTCALMAAGSLWLMPYYAKTDWGKDNCIVAWD
jgi:hypothetical protein